MSYIKKNLIKDENIIHISKYHWIIFFNFWLIILFLFSILWLFSSQSIFEYTIGYVILGYVITIILRTLINIITTEFVITNKRVIIKEGLISKYFVELLLSKIEGINVYQSIFGRILGYGSIHINTIGGDYEPFNRIKYPMMFRKKVLEQMENNV